MRFEQVTGEEATECELPFVVGLPLGSEAMASAQVGTHLLLSVPDGVFVSLLDPPPRARPAAASGDHEGAFPVLAGDANTRDLLRVGTVDEVREDCQGRSELALILDDDPAGALYRANGRGRLHLHPHEVELVGRAP